MITLQPKVFKKGGKKRYGKGFSRDELKKAGINVRKALNLNLPIDVRRRTVHQENIEILKTFLQSQKTKPKLKGKPKS